MSSQRKNNKQVRKMHNNKKSARRTGPVGPGSRGNVGRGRLGLSDYPRAVTSRRMQTIAEDEYIGEIAGSVGFVTTAYAVNPGQSSVFPWGARIAALYEEYEPELLEFYYKREVSEYASNGQTGKIMLSFDYDAADTPPTSKQQVEDTVPHVDGMPSDPTLCLKLDCSRIKKNLSKYVRPGAQPANTDLKTYDCGVLSVSTFGCAGTTTIGELRVRYRFKFSEPVLENSQLMGGVVHFSGTVPTSANLFATAALQPGGTPSMTGITALADAISFPAGIAGNYLILLSATASTSVAAITPNAFTGGVANVNLYTSTTRDAIGGTDSLASTVGYSSFAVQTISVPSGGGTTSFNGPAIVGGIGMDLWIFALPYTVLTVMSKFEAAVNERLREMEARFALVSLRKDALCTRVEEWESDDNKEEKMDLSASQSNLASQLVSLLSKK